MTYLNNKLIAAFIGILLLNNSSSSNAQTILSQKTFGGRFTETVSQINPTLDSGFIVAANTSSLNGDVTGYHEGFGTDCWISKLNSSNQLQWQRTIGGSGNDVATAVRTTTDSGFIVVGYSNSNDGDISGNHGGYDFLVVKLDKNDSILWQKSIGGSGDDIATDIRQTSDGGFIVAGYSNSTDSLVSGNHGANDFWIVKLNADGSIQWQKSYGGLGDDKSTAIQQTSDNGYIVVGFSNSNDGNLTINNGNNDYWVIKLAANGSIQWQKSLGGSGNDFATAVVESLNGGYLVAGYTFSVDGDVTNNHGNTDYWLVKLDGNGSFKWQKTYGGSDNDYARSVIQTKEGGYVVGGYTASVDGDVSTNQGYDDEWVIRTDSLGNQLWQKTLGGSYNDRLFSIAKADGTNLSIVGITNSSDGDIVKNQGSYDCWIVKLADATPLPIKLVAFNAIAATNQRSINTIVTWKTSIESGIKNYIIERSMDGEQYVSIGQVKPNNSANSTYRFVDTNPIEGINYYRLKTTEIDGGISYSSVASVLFESKQPQIAVYPNPTTISEARISFKNISVGNYSISLYDLIGKRTYSQKIEHLAANSIYKLDIANKIPSGYHLLQVKDSKGKVVAVNKVLFK